MSDLVSDKMEGGLVAPFVLLGVVSLLARGLGACGIAYVASWPAALAVGLAAMFVMTGSAHFTRSRRSGLVAIVPPGLPRPGLLVTLTGVLELAGAAGLLVPPAIAPTRAAAATGLAILMVVMFPANVYAAGARRSPSSPTTPLGIRTILQCAFVAAAVVVAWG